MKLKFTLLVNLLCCAFFAHAQTNVALNKQVVASVTNTGAFSANEAVDGNATTSRWGTPSEDGPHWIYVDLGAIHNISQIRIDWEAAKASVFEVQTSDNAINWTTRINGTNPTGLTQHVINDFTGLNLDARYVRIYCTARSSVYGYSIWELEVFSTTVPTNLAPKVNLTTPANNATFATPATIQLQANATDADGTIAKVEFYNGNTKLGENTNTPYSYTWSNVTAGNYSITAVATDNSGNVTTSAARNVTVQLPVVTPQCGGLGFDSDYTYKFSWDTTNPTITFIPNPNRPTVGSNTLILHYNTTGVDPLPGYNIVPNTPYPLTATNGQTVHFYFTYSIPAGGNKNNAATRHQFVVGSCNSSLNLALNQPVEASSVQGGAVATLANDGNPNTPSRWESAHNADIANQQWIYVDLGSTYDLSGVNILWENAKADEYTIQVSNNTSSWTDILTVTGNAAEPNQRNHAVTGSGRYLRILGTKKTVDFFQYGYSIFELQVFGTPNTGPLPVSLISFDSKLNSNGSVNLTWATSSEQNNSYFLVERSADGKTFGLLSKVNSKGSNSQSRLDYQHIDRTPLAGANYYRLTQFDLNGDSKIVGHTTQNVSLTAQSLTLSPNPLSGTELTVNVSNTKTATAKITISNITGTIIYSETVNVAAGLVKLNLSNKPAPGIYLVKVSDLPTQKLIIK